MVSPQFCSGIIKVSLLPTAITPAISAYLSKLQPIDDDLLKELKFRSETAGIPSIHISEDEAALLQFLVKSLKFERILEIGTLAGYSSIVMGRSLSETGSILTLELNPLHVGFANRFIQRAGLPNKIYVREGDARKSLKSIESEPFDFIFIDADKPSYDFYFDICMEKFVRPGTLLGFDNALAFGNIVDENDQTEEVVAIREINKKLFSDPRLDCVLVPVGDGLLLARVK